MSKTDSLRDRIYDAIAEGRRTLRVGNAKPAAEGSTTFFCSFLLTVDSKTYEALRALADTKERSVPRLLRRFVKYGFRDCFSEEPVIEPLRRLSA